MENNELLETLKRIEALIRLHLWCISGLENEKLTDAACSENESFAIEREQIRRDMVTANYFTTMLNIPAK